MFWGYKVRAGLFTSRDFHFSKTLNLVQQGVAQEDNDEAFLKVVMNFVIHQEAKWSAPNKIRARWSSLGCPKETKGNVIVDQKHKQWPRMCWPGRNKGHHWLVRLSFDWKGVEGLCYYEEHGSLKVKQLRRPVQDQRERTMISYWKRFRLLDGLLNVLWYGFCFVIDAEIANFVQVR